MGEAPVPEDFAARVLAGIPAPEPTGAWRKLRDLLALPHFAYGTAAVSIALLLIVFARSGSEFDPAAHNALSPVAQTAPSPQASDAVALTAGGVVTVDIDFTVNQDLEGVDFHVILSDGVAFDTDDPEFARQKEINWVDDISGGAASVTVNIRAEKAGKGHLYAIIKKDDFFHVDRIDFAISEAQRTL